MADFSYEDWLNWRWGKEGPERRANIDAFVHSLPPPTAMDYAAEALRAFINDAMRTSLRDLQAQQAGILLELQELEKRRQAIRTELMQQVEAAIGATEFVPLVRQELRPAHTVNPSNIAGRGLVPELAVEVVGVDNVGRLLEVRQWGNPIGRLVELKDPKDDQAVFLCVDPSVQTPRAAVAWSFGLEPDEYAPEVET